MKPKRWILPKQADIQKVRFLSKSINVSHVLATLLVQKQIETFEQAKHFFRPSLEDLYNPFDMKGMKRAVDSISESIADNCKILIYGDYDVDGTTSVAMMYLFLKQFTENIDYYIPDRYTEGYGISYQGIDYAYENRCNMIITLDCGIKAIKQVAYAKSKHIDVVICDHHTPASELPDALVILNPKQKDCNYPYKELSGCGVGFKLIQAICKHKNISEEKIYKYLDFLVLSIASDIVPITDENRILAYYGLKRFNENKRESFKILLSSRSKQQCTISDLVFGIAPKINAVGRIKHAKSAVELLIEDDINKVKSLA